MSPIVLVFAVVLAALTLAAFRARASIARQVALQYAAATAATILVSGARFRGTQWPLFAVDALLLCGLLWIMFRTPALWPTIAVALQAVTVLGHVARVTEVDVDPMTYAIMLQWTAWPAMLTLGAGILLDRRAGRTSSAS